MADRSNTAFGETLKDKPAPVQEIAWAARDLIFEALPNATEVVWVKDGNATYGTGPRKMLDQFLWLGSYAGHVSLGFYYGADLPDPDGLLEGTGKRMRHVKLRSLEDVQRPELRALLEVAVREAIEHHVPPPQNDKPVSIRK